MHQETMFQICPRNKWRSVVHWSLTASIYWGLRSYFSPKLDSCSIDRVFVEIYEVQFFRADFRPIHECMWLPFLTTLNIYKDHFKGCKKLCTVSYLIMASFSPLVTILNQNKLTGLWETVPLALFFRCVRPNPREWVESCYYLLKWKFDQLYFPP